MQGCSTERKKASIVERWHNIRHMLQYGHVVLLHWMGRIEYTGPGLAENGLWKYVLGAGEEASADYHPTRKMVDLG